MKSAGMKRITKVVCIGDSITEGYGISDDPYGPYPAQLQKLLGPEFKVYNQGVSCTCSINRTLNGRTVGMPYVLEKKWEEALDISGDIYIVLHGTNDAQNGYNEEEDRPDDYNNVYAFREFFREDYMKMLYEIRRRRPEAAIFSVKPIPVTDHCIWRKHKQIYLEDILRDLDALWKENPWLYTADLQSAFLRIPEMERDKLYQLDGVHPGKLGAGLIAETIGNAILEYMKSDKEK